MACFLCLFKRFVSSGSSSTIAWSSSSWNNEITIKALHMNREKLDTPVRYFVFTKMLNPRRKIRKIYTIFLILTQTIHRTSKIARPHGGSTSNKLQISIITVQENNLITSILRFRSTTLTCFTVLLVVLHLNCMITI